MKTKLGLLLGLVVTANAFADSRTYVCVNLDAKSTQPDNVILEALPDGLSGLFNGANAFPPRELFSAAPADTISSSELLFGPIQFQGNQDSVISYSKVDVKFSDTGAMASVEFSTDKVITTYGKCVVDPDNE